MGTGNISAELQEIWTNIDQTTDKSVGFVENPRLSETGRVRNQNRVILSKGQEVHNAGQDHLRNEPDGL
jgi:single-stranded DNA-specific DHH superfamily exonuclease